MDEDYSDLEAVRDSGDSVALGRIISRHKESVFRYVYRIVGNEADAAEITEDVFVKVYFNASKYRVKAKVKTWIFTIATNTSKDHLRKHKKRRKDVSIHQKLDQNREVGDLIASNDSDVATDAENNELMDLLLQSIDRLPESYRIPFVFCKLEGHSHQECAEMLKTTPKVVEMKIYRAKKKLMKLVQSTI